MDTFVGQQFGNYQTLKLLGRGGFSEVYLCEQIGSGRKFALKLLDTEVNPDEFERLKQEALRLEKLKHHHIVSIRDFGIKASKPYLVMDYAGQGKLTDLHPQGTRVPLLTVREYIEQIADALQYMHEHNFIHCDLKPDNLLIGDKNNVLLSDFGLAIQFCPEQSLLMEGPITRGERIYTAPELENGKPCPASDQYSLAAIVYEWLCGKPPRSSFEIEFLPRNTPITPPHRHDRMISAEVEKVILKALEEDPKQRYKSVQVFATAFERASKSTEEMQAKRIIRRRILLGVSGIIGMGILGSVGTVVWRLTSTLVTTTSTVNLPPSKPPGTLYLTYQGHDLGVEAVAWSPDGKYIASGGQDNTVQVWNAMTKNTIFTLSGHLVSGQVVSWSPDGTRIVSASQDSTVQVWDPFNNGNVFATYYGHTNRVNVLAWSPDGKYIASGGDDQTVQVWEATNGAHVYTYHGHTDVVYGLAWSSDSKRVASGSADKTVQVWNATNGGQVFTYHGHTDAINALAWSPNGKHIASGSKDLTVQVWDAPDGANVFTYTRHTKAIDAVAWSHDSQWIASGSDDKTVQVWQTTTSASNYAYLKHTRAVLALAWSPDNQRIASGSLDQTVQVWQA